MHDDMEHGPKCQCIECQSLTDLENEWRYEYQREMSFSHNAEKE